MRTIIHSFSLAMMIIIAILGYCLFKYSEGFDKISKANSLCSINYSMGKFMDNNLLGKFDPILGQWTNQVFKYLGQACFYTITHLNGAFDSKIKWDQTQIYNTHENHSLDNNVNYGREKINNKNYQQRVIEDE
jgi:hypothetical protein